MSIRDIPILIGIVTMMAAFAGIPALLVWLVSRRLSLRYRIALAICIAVAGDSLLLALNWSAGASGLVGAGLPASLAHYSELSLAAFGVCAVSLLVFAFTCIRGVWVALRSRRSNHALEATATR